MSFGNKHIDNSYDQWVTQTPEDYFDNYETETGEGYFEDKEEPKVIKVKKGEQREAGWLYFVKGENLEVFKCKMARRGKKDE